MVIAFSLFAVFFAGLIAGTALGWGVGWSHISRRAIADRQAEILRQYEEINRRLEEKGPLRADRVIREQTPDGPLTTREEIEFYPADEE
jgi:hypothetical protein